MRTTLLLALLLLAIFAHTQAGNADSLKRLLQTEKHDTSQVVLLAKLGSSYMYSKPDTALILAQQALALSQKAGFTRGEAISLNTIGNIFLLTGNYPKALQVQQEGLRKAEAIGDEPVVSRLLSNIGNVHSSQGNYRQAVDYYLKSLSIFQRLNNKKSIQISVSNLGDAYTKLGRLDSASYYATRAYDMSLSLKNGDAIGIALNNLGNIYSRLGRADSALIYYRSSLPYYAAADDDDGFCEAYLGMAALFRKAGQADSALHYAKLSLEAGKRGGFIVRIMDAAGFLTEYYTAVDKIDSAFVYQTATIAAKDSLFSQEKQREFQSLSYDETLRQQQIQEAKKEAQTQLKFNALFGSLGTLLVVAFLLYRNNRQKQKANVQLAAQKQKVESTLQELKSTQAQLVQSEKMASLGELTAGIAHEIQNPLNFVNNFAQLNKEMLAEMREEIEHGNYGEVKNIARNIEANEEKIAHHGRRADAIVKGMLQHSRHSTGEKEPTNINAVADEYLRLSLFALKTKDKTFNATLKTDYDTTIGKVAVVPQDIGRVLLNLFNNAFYAVREKKAAVAGTEEPPYEPTVSVSTKKSNGHIEIQVGDNGTGIPQHVLDKIYQPFFTTKPSGQGTGLGLSLSYDIITKEHNGTIQVESNEEQGTVFVIKLPC